MSVIGEVIGGPRRRPYSLVKVCLLMLTAAAVGGALFNLLMPQGLDVIPPEVRSPLWQKATMEEAKRLFDEGALFVDARDAGSYSQARVRGAVKLPAEELDQIFPLLKPMLDMAPALVVYGRSYSRYPAATVGQFLRRQGLTKVYVAEACLDSLRAAGLPVQEPRRRAQK